MRGHAAFGAGRWAEAAEAFGKAVTAAGDGAGGPLRRNLAVSLERAGRLDAAVKAYEKAYRASEDGEVAFLLGKLLRRLGHEDPASRWLANAVRLEPGRWEAAFELGLAELALGRPKRAEKAFRAVVARRPNDPAALQNLAKARVDAGMDREAVRVFERLASLRPDDPAPVLTIAALMQRMDRPSDAANWLKLACLRGAREACR
jgi:tetratricopeptide (TPR) repeat protein